MRKVLIVTHLVRASPRITGLAKYLPEFGWEPIVLTAPLHLGHSLGHGKDATSTTYRTIIVEYVDSVDCLSSFLKRRSGFEAGEGVRRQSEKRYGSRSVKSMLVGFALRLFKEIFYYPDQDKSLKNPAITSGRQLLEKEPVDAIISSSSPVTSHLIAKNLKAQQDLPWVADLRDLWSQNHNYSYTGLRKMLDRRLEKKTLRAADALVTVAEPLVEKLKTLHKEKQVYSVPNGFDPEEVNPGRKLTAKFTITYTGQIYRGKQDPLKILNALKKLIDEGTIDPSNVEVRFYGYEEVWLAAAIKDIRLAGIVKQFGEIPRKEALEKQQESQVLLLLNFEDPSEKGTVTMKIFEYLAAKRPIIVTGGFDEDVKEQMLSETKAGIYTKDEQSIEKTLKNMYTEYKAKGKVSYRGKEEKINQYSHREMAKKFAKILDGLQ
ncbi:MAG: glycosyltransferase [Thaumarchaeota archaeon]|nr:glycosyltransferase [Nitrososphaerota archaeon]